MIISQHGDTAVIPLTFIDRFDRVAKQTEYLTGHPSAFVGRTRAALQLKLDELIRSTSGAHNVMLTLEDMPLEEIEKYREHYEHWPRRLGRK